MADYIIMAAVAAAIVLQLVLRTNTAVCYLALCAGSVLLGASGQNAGLIASSLTSGMSSSVHVAKISLLFVPFLVTAVLLRNQLGKAMLPLGFIPAACTALLGVILIAPLLSDSMEQAVVVSESWKVLMQYQEAIIGLGMVTSIVLIAMTLKRPSDKHKKGHH